jgi:hypothetical protein
MAGEDEPFSNLEIVFWWFGDDASSSIEDELDGYLEPEPRRRRRAPLPRRRPEP